MGYINRGSVVMKDDEFLRNWEVLKPLILGKWDRLHESDMHGIQPNVDELVRVIHSKYTETPKLAIREEVENLAHQILKNS